MGSTAQVKGSSGAKQPPAKEAITRYPAVEIRGLSLDLGDFRLRDIDLSITEGEYFVILGPTGAGKTVLLEALAGLVRPSRGKILFDGVNVTHLPPEQRGIGFLYQDYALFPHLSVAQNIGYGLRLRGVAQDETKRRVSQISELLGIGHLLHRSPGTLSGGEQQRVAMARALIVEPKLLLLDEPLSALDPELRLELQRELLRIHEAYGATTLHVTHNFEEAVAMADRIAVVHQGQVVQVGTPENIFRRPSSEFVARFVGVRNIFQGHLHVVEAGFQRLRLNGLEIAIATDFKQDGQVHCSIRPEDIIVSRQEILSSARNCFRGRITHIDDRGTLVYVTVRVPRQPGEDNGVEFISAITRRSLRDMGLHEGQAAYIAFKASAVHVF